MIIFLKDIPRIIRKCQFGEEYTGGRKNIKKDVQFIEKRKAPNERSSGMINIGWILTGISIRGKNGDRTRSIPVEISGKKGHPNGVYTYDLLDYKQLEFDDNFTARDLFKITGLTTLRFYRQPICEHDSSSDRENRNEPRKSTKETNAKKILKQNNKKNSINRRKRKYVDNNYRRI